MADKPTIAAGYGGGQTEFVRATCLYVATKLGDIMDELVVVGGLVPSLLVNQQVLPIGADSHVGTMDLDIGLAVAVLEDGRYRTLAERLRNAGFEQDTSDRGHPTRQRWRILGRGRVTVDFLIPPSLPGDRGGTLRDIEQDFAAIIVPGMHLAFRDREHVEIAGETIFGERATRTISVCGPGAYVVLKALAFRLRGENKDAYDLYYVVRNYGAGIDDVASRLQPLLCDPSAEEAVRFLREDFGDHDSLGPRRVAEFILKRPDDEIQADVVGFVRELLSRCS